MTSLLFCITLAVAFVGISVVECTSKTSEKILIRCPENQIYASCVNPCNNCRDRGICSFTKECKRGCDCKEGYYKDAEGHCVLEEFCDSEAVGRCFPDEEFLKCGCVLTCCNARQYNPCASQCLKGCFCRDGRVRNKFGRCINLEDCPKEPQIDECDEEEEYYDHKPDCKNTCDNFDDPAVICPVGEPGCFCKDGLVQRKDGKCIPPNECPDKVCGINEEFKSCGFCDPTCEMNPPICPHYCKRVCLCLKGFVRSKTGECIPENECPPKGDTSPLTSTTTEGSASPLTSSTVEETSSPLPSTTEASNCTSPMCEEECSIDYTTKPCPSCNCLLGPPTGPPCGANEQYDPCGTACPATCENYGKNETCTNKTCVSGCFCNPSLVRQDDGECINPDKCVIVPNCTFPTCGSECTIDYTSEPCPTCDCVPPPPTESPCGRKETYYACGTACPETCENYGKNETCTNVNCVSGCFCNTPLVRNDEGECVHPDDCFKTTTKCYITTCDPGCTVDYNLKPCPGCICTTTAPTTVSTPEPPIKCPKGMKYSSCFPWCPGTCENIIGVNGLSCRYKCYEACCCKDIFQAMTRDGKCIHRDNCTLADVCTREETVGTCEKGCPRTCSNPTGACTKPCIIGCFCKNELVRADNGSCIPQEECKEHCPRNEEFKLCGTACQRTCDNYRKQITCNYKCVTGCFCKSGLVRNKRGKCVRPCQCKKRRKCGKHEVFKKCGTTCPASCLEPNPVFCPNFCVRGCFCEDGYVRTDKGKCVLPEKCPLTPQKCPKLQEYYQCKPTCRHTCPNRNDPLTKCTKICARGCFCRKGLVMNTNGKCVPPEKCPKVCGKDEQYYDHIPNCKNNCGTYSDPGVKCALGPPGCFCKEGLMKRGDGECVKPEDC